MEEVHNNVLIEFEKVHLVEKNTDFYYVDAVPNFNMTTEKLEEDIKRLEKESRKLTDWPPT